MSQARTLIRGGTVVTMESGIPDGIADILIEGDTIAAIGPDLQADDPTTAVVDATDHIVLPGFIDTHRHLWQTLLRGLASDWSLIQFTTAMFGTIGQHFTAEDMYLANRLGALDALDAGVTAVFDWSHNQVTPDHTDALVAALESTGIRATFGYGASGAEWAECLVPPYRSTTPTPEKEVRRLRAGRFASDAGRLTLGLAARGPELSTMDVVKQDWAMARDLGIRLSAHIGQGIFPGRPAIVALADAGLLGPDLTIGHCNQLTDQEIALMADHGVTATVTPEDESSMGHGWPPIAKLIRGGVWPNIGIDTCSAVGGDMFTAMRFAVAIPRAQANGALLDKGENPWALEIKGRDALRMATIEGARALGQADRIGSLAVGKQADLISIKAADVSMLPLIDPIAGAVHYASRGVIDDVFVGGSHVKKNGKLAGVDAGALLAEATEASAQIMARSGIAPGWAPSAP